LRPIERSPDGLKHVLIASVLDATAQAREVRQVGLGGSTIPGMLQAINVSNQPMKSTIVEIGVLAGPDVVD